MLNLEPHPHSSIPYVNTGFSTVLWMRNLFSNDREECFPMSQCISRVLRSSCLRFVFTWSFQVKRLSNWSSRYLAVSAPGYLRLQTHTQSNTHYFSTATTVARTRLNVTLHVLYIACLVNYIICFQCCTVHIDLIHFIFTNLCTCISANINANTLRY